jgi:glycosyltransferase involved in cell wall biosynthesis
MKKTIAFIIAYNCGPMLGKAYEKIPKPLVDEIILSDDGSSDNTENICKNLDLIYFKNPTNLGYGGNIRESLKRCFELGADYAVEIHGDGAQFNPVALYEAQELMENNCDLILGSRFIVPGQARKNGMPVLRFMANKGLSFFDRLVLRLPLSEFHTGFRIYSKQFYETIPLDENSSDYLFSFEVIAQAAYFQLSVAEVPVEADYIGEHTSHKLSGAAIYALQTFLVLFKFLLAKYFHLYSKQFPRVA